MHFGVILPNYGRARLPTASAASQRPPRNSASTRSGRPSTSSSGPEAVDPYGRVYDQLVTLGWIAGWTERVGLGTSIVLVPPHRPMHLAKQVATLQKLSGGRFTLGSGWAGTKTNSSSWVSSPLMVVDIGVRCVAGPHALQMRVGSP